MERAMGEGEVEKKPKSKWYPAPWPGWLWCGLAAISFYFIVFFIGSGHPAPITILVLPFFILFPDSIFHGRLDSIILYFLGPVTWFVIGCGLYFFFRRFKNYIRRIFKGGLSA